MAATTGKRLDQGAVAKRRRRRPVRPGAGPPAAAAGVTLVELLVVVALLALLGATVLPQLAGSTDDARVAALATTLARLRDAVERYTVEHGHRPGARASLNGTCPGGGKAGSAKIDTSAGRALAFAEQLTMFSKNNGETCSVQDRAFKHGPYLRTAVGGEAGIPINPVSGRREVRVVDSGSLVLEGAVEAGGWLYDAVTGKLAADDAAYDHL